LFKKTIDFESNTLSLTLTIEHHLYYGKLGVTSISSFPFTYVIGQYKFQREIYHLNRIHDTGVGLQYIINSCVVHSYVGEYLT